MTIVEKAAYLKGLTEGLGIEPGSKEGKLWGFLNELLADMAHEIEDLQSTSLDFADTLDEFSEDLSFLEELTCDLDTPDDFFPALDPDDDCSLCESGCGGDCSACAAAAEDEDDEEDEDEDELEYDGIIYDVTCPVCGEEISFDEDTLSEGSIVCPSCGETLEFEMDED